MTIQLIDDGTMDTVLRCSDCGEEMRYSAPDVADDDQNTVEQDHDGGYWRIRFHGELLSVGYVTKQCAQNLLDEWLRDEWLKEIIAEATDEHECADSE